MKVFSKNNLSLIGAIALLVAALAYSYTTRKSIAYVRTGYFLESFKGTLDAADQVDSYQKQLTQIIDSASKGINEKIELLNANHGILSPEEEASLYQEIKVRQAHFQEFAERKRIEFSEKQETVQNMVLNQANSYMEKYGRENGYDLILGTTETGSLLFGSETMDITEDLIIAVNNMYENSGKL